MANDFTYRSQNVSFLGFLENQLRDIQGIAALTYELIQNAEDVKKEEARPGATWISFDVRDEALVVENDGVFRPEDFERLQSIAGGGKRSEAGTIGAFGFGFIAVYEVTDAPEIFSGGRHWTIRPEAPSGERIRERTAETSGTCIRLPWAVNPGSTVREALRLPAIDPGSLDELAGEIAEAVELAALFLNQLECLEVKREGTVLYRVNRDFPGSGDAGRRLHLRRESGKAATWLLVKGAFAASASSLRSSHPQIEANRDPQVQLALSLDAVVRQGRLFAGLPTESIFPLPFHVNADFYPTSDRKRIHLGDGYQAAWNEEALRSAAITLVDNLDALRQQLVPRAFWQLLQQVAYTGQLALQGDLPAALSLFWQTLAPALADHPILYTAKGTWIRPAAGRLPEEAPGRELQTILDGLDLPLPHPHLAGYYGLMRDRSIGVPPLALVDLVQALDQAGLTRTTFLHEAPAFLRSLDQWRTLWDLFDRQVQGYARPQVRVEEKGLLDRVAIVLTEEMTLERPSRVFRGNPEARALFPDVAWAHPELPERSFPGRLVAEFNVRQAVTLLGDKTADRLEEEWRMGRLDLPRLFRWFESQQIEILADDPALRREIRRLPLCPVAGELRPLAHLYIPGGFEDPLGLAGIVPLEKVGGRRQFLQDLGVEALSFDAYVHRELPRVLTEKADLPSDARHHLLRLLAERLGEIRDDDELQEQLSHLPLIPCLDGSFRPAREVYATRDAYDLLGGTVHVAEPVSGQAQAALFRWLGVRADPSAADLIKRLLQLGEQEDGGLSPADAIQAANECWEKLQEHLDEGQIEPDALVPLRGKRVIPTGRRLAPPDQLFFDGLPGLAGYFPDLPDHLLDPGHPAARAWALVGVQSLAAAVRREPLTPSGVEGAPELEARLKDRLPLIRRIILAEVGESRYLEHLEDVHVVTADPLQIRYQLAVGDEKWLSPAQSAPVVMDSNHGRLVVAGDGLEADWLAIAQELVRELKVERAPGAMPLALRDVLAAESFSAAEQLLDALGYPSRDD